MLFLFTMQKDECLFAQLPAIVLVLIAFGFGARVTGGFSALFPIAITLSEAIILGLSGLFYSGESQGRREGKNGKRNNNLFHFSYSLLI
jgi:hypothetical protein